ncbi:Pentatricopeptide repeat-containing protein [Thalictrum thalictroides]|uniref:Pentatricopeptide repeat-containing protein n=1 Tax=Thalictrum thalictroides TaxID=46969 RepID=A0A7J6WWR8_THATH|nr:Pentatricopeptide repeat-containing protein [Thalictrum thalictroides]
MISNEFIPDTYLQTKILMLYARSGELNDLLIARKLFDEMLERNSTSWNTMIIAYSQMEDHSEVLDLFSRMQRAGILPDKFTFPSVVKACVALEDWNGVCQVHGFVIKTGLNENLVVGGSLVDGYVRFGLMDEAVNAFEEVDGKNVIIWNAIISGYVKIMRWEEAWSVFHRMEKLGVVPDQFTFATVLRACSFLRSLDRGMHVHAKLIVQNFVSDVFVGNSLIDMYAKCGDLDSCLQVFDDMIEKNQVTWNLMISAKVQYGQFVEALALFSRMCMMGFKMDQYNLGSILMACVGLLNVQSGRELHGYLIRNSLDSDVILGSSLVDMYSKCGYVEKARQAFNRLINRNIVTWNSLISGYVQEGMVEEALKLYHEMEQHSTIQPDQYTFTNLLALCADQGDTYLGMQIHAHAIRMVTTNRLIIETELVHMYAKCGLLNYAQHIFDRMEVRNSYSWNSLIEGYEQNGQAKKSLELFKEMQATGIKPDCFSLASAVSACIKLSDIRMGKETHGFIVRNSLEKLGILKCVLVDMYAKCGDMDYACNAYNQTSKKDVNIQNVMVSAFVGCGRMDDARRLFDEMEERNIISWNSIILGFSKVSKKEETFKLFIRMLKESVEFDTSTLVTLFNFCANLPALPQGIQLHTLAIKTGLVNTSITMDSTLIDMYAKGGDIIQARRFFDKMTEKNIVSWNTMITGYGKHGYSEEVLVLYEHMQEEGMHLNDVTLLSVLSACSHTGLTKEGIEIFIAMLEDHRLEATAAHYTCMVDLLGRAGRLEDAKEVIERMPVKPEVSTWGALLGACRVHQNVEMGRHAADHLFEMDPLNPGHYVLMSNIYAAAGSWKEVEEVRSMMKIRGVRKDAGVSWIEINNEIQTFYAGAKSHPKSKEIYANLRHLTQQMKRLGYVPDTKFVLSNTGDLEEEEYLFQHSERLAISLGLISLSEKSTIRVFKNLRVCGDCHTVTKFISKITNRRIIVRDTNRFHHFENGVCSCGDYW